jgi:RHS repeat-associated protein
MCAPIIGARFQRLQKDGQSPTEFYAAAGTRCSTENGSFSKSTDFEVGTPNQSTYVWARHESPADSNLVHNQARHFDPTIGRWFSAEPFGFEDGDADVYPYPTASLEK